MLANPAQVCPLCNATIDPALGSANEVRFSAGANGSRAKLWARVCQYAQERGGCINSNPALRSEPNPTDFYGEAPPIELNP
ncbi:MAG TPA: hypothetical protein DEB19_05715 [Synechococcales bacterium UBA8138]|nr:hypothetical protein [Synechococcaceae bacterium WB4_2_0805]HBU26799.1 hypothetical protein [Synechococcales bacterium UBA8138]